MMEIKKISEIGGKSLSRKEIIKIFELDLTLIQIYLFFIFMDN